MSSELGELKERYGFIFEAIDKNEANLKMASSQNARFNQNEISETSGVNMASPQTGQFINPVRPRQYVRDTKLKRPTVIVNPEARNVPNREANVSSQPEVLLGVDVSVGKAEVNDARMADTAREVTTRQEVNARQETNANLRNALIDADNAAASIVETEMDGVKRVKHKNYRSLSCLLIAGVLGVVMGASAILILVYSGVLMKKTEVITKTELIQTSCMECDCENEDNKKNNTVVTNTTNTTVRTIEPDGNVTETRVTNTTNSTNTTEE